jgi:hypothetical protein
MCCRTTRWFIKGSNMTELVRQSERLLLNGFLVLLIMAISVGYGIWLGKSRAVPPAPPKVHSMAPTVIQLEKIGELTTTRVHVTDVLWAEGEGYRGSWLISGDALLSCDVSKTTVMDVDPVAHTATIRLAPLRVISSRVDHSKTKTWNVEKTTWLPWKLGDQGAMRDAAMYHAQKLIETAAGSERHLGPAKAQAELLIRQMYDFVEWKVVVEWQ